MEKKLTQHISAPAAGCNSESQQVLPLQLHTFDVHYWSKHVLYSTTSDAFLLFSFCNLDVAEGHARFNHIHFNLRHNRKELEL